MTKPLRRLSNGQQASAGSGQGVSAVMLPKPATPIGEIAASEPPAMIASR